MTEIVGVLPVLVVPFKKDATIDFESIPRLVEHCLSNEIQGLVIFGLASELYKLTDYERVEILKKVAKKKGLVVKQKNYHKRVLSLKARAGVGRPIWVNHTCP